MGWQTECFQVDERLVRDHCLWDAHLCQRPSPTNELLLHGATLSAARLILRAPLSEPLDVKCLSSPDEAQKPTVRFS